MLNLVLLTSNATAAAGIEQLTQETGQFKIIFNGSPIPSIPDVIRNLRVHDPELILLDVGDWEAVSTLAGHIRKANLRAILIGFRPEWNRLEQLTLEDAGIRDLLREPFSPAELQGVAYDALHREHPVTNRNILAFLPAKAGAGCSTVALNTAGALAALGKRVLLIESDRRSGVLSILLNLQSRTGLSEALQRSGEMTPVEWHQLYVDIAGMHLLLANPARRLPLPTWADYYQLLRFIQQLYDFVIVDLPEVVNDATAEIVRSARAIFVVCTQEVPSLNMANLRCSELEACEIPKNNIHLIVNRWERGDQLSPADVETNLGRPVFGTVLNDYQKVRESIYDARLVAADSDFTAGCQALARKLSGLPEAPQGRLRFALLQKLGRITG